MQDESFKNAVADGTITTEDVAELKAAKRRLGSTSWRNKATRNRRRSEVKTLSQRLWSKIHGVTTRTHAVVVKTDTSVEAMRVQLNGMEKKLDDLHRVQVQGRLTDAHEALSLQEIRAQNRACKTALTTVGEAAKIREKEENEDRELLMIAKKQGAAADPQATFAEIQARPVYRCNFLKPGSRKGCQRKVRAEGHTCWDCRQLAQDTSMAGADAASEASSVFGAY